MAISLAELERRVADLEQDLNKHLALIHVLITGLSRKPRKDRIQTFFAAAKS